MENTYFNRFSGMVVRLIKESTYVGCGVFVSKEGLVLTTPSSGKDSEYVVCNDGSMFKHEVLYDDLDANLALLKLESPSGVFDYATLSPPNSLTVGMTVICIGCLGGCFDLCSVKGEVSCPQRKIADLLENFERTKMVSDIQHGDYRTTLTRRDQFKLSEVVTVVELNNVFGWRDGSWGSPLFDVSGQLIGLYGFIANGRSFAIHVDIIRAFLEQLDGGQEKKKGKVSHPSASTSRT